MAEKLSLPLNLWLFHDSHGLLGVLTQVSPSFSVPRHSANTTSVSTIGLVNGGTAGLIWMFFVCWIGFLLVNTSMAEMASMYVSLPSP